MSCFSTDTSLTIAQESDDCENDDVPCVSPLHFVCPYWLVSASIAANSTASAATLVSFGVEVTLADRLGMIRAVAGPWSYLSTDLLRLDGLFAVAISKVIAQTVLVSAMTHCFSGVSGMGLVVFILIFEQVMGVGGLYWHRHGG